MGPHRRAAVLATCLLPLGTIGGHAAGDLLAGQPAAFDGSHSHLRPATWLTALAAVAALGWLAGARRHRPARPPLWVLAGGQALLFLALEAGEYVAGGHGLAHLAADPGVRWGLVAQVGTAAVLAAAALTARASGDRVRAFLSARRRPAIRRAPSLATPAVAVLRTRVPWSPATSRGPPLLLVTST